MCQAIQATGPGEDHCVFKILVLQIVKLLVGDGMGLVTCWSGNGPF